MVLIKTKLNMDRPCIFMLFTLIINNIAQTVAGIFIMKTDCYETGKTYPEIVILGITMSMVFIMQIYFVYEMKRIRIYLESKDPKELSDNLKKFTFY